MKALMILGAIVGFLIGSGFGLAGNTAWPATLWRACAAALVGGILARWWSRVCLNNLRDSLNDRRTLRAAAPGDPKPNTKL